MNHNWPHIIFAQQSKFTREWLENELFPEAREMRKVVKRGGCDLLKGKRAISLFYQPSTRTAGSLAMAMDYLGGRVVFSTDNAREFSSAAKGETLQDGIRNWNCYKPDIIFLRYDREIGAEIAANVSAVPIINAGDRQPADRPQSPFSGQHPTQAFLDLFTIQERLGHIDNITIAMVGDLVNGRTVRSLSYLLGKFVNIKIYFVSPKNAQMREDVKEYLVRHRVLYEEVTDLRDVASELDALYQTRVQTECGTVFDDTKGYFIVDRCILDLMKKESVILHPLPRVDEITMDVDKDPRAAYLTDQPEAGLFTRMAVIKMILANRTNMWRKFVYKCRI